MATAAKVRLDVAIHNFLTNSSQKAVLVRREQE
jgi:hypothetical protein